MFGVVSGHGTALFALPGSAELLSVFRPQTLVDAFHKGLVLLIPRVGGHALDGLMGVTSKAHFLLKFDTSSAGGRGRFCPLATWRVEVICGGRRESRLLAMNAAAACCDSK